MDALSIHLQVFFCFFCLPLWCDLGIMPSQWLFCQRLMRAELKFQQFLHIKHSYINLMRTLLVIVLLKVLNQHPLPTWSYNYTLLLCLRHYIRTSKFLKKKKIGKKTCSIKSVCTVNPSWHFCLISFHLCICYASYVHSKERLLR